jgi:hypothetical protein
MLTSRLLGIFAVLSALVSPGAEFAVARDAPANDFSSLLEWKNQIAADIEHNKRYLPGVRTRGKIGVVYFDLNINRAGWVLPGTRIVTVDRELGSAALLLLQQSQPFPAPDHVGAFAIQHSASSCRSGSTKSLLSKPRGFRTWSDANSWSVTKRTVRSSTISAGRRRIGRRNLRPRYTACRMDVSRQSVRAQSASVGRRTR